MNINSHNHIVSYGEPFSRRVRRRNRGFAGVNYNYRSPQVIAMNAHLRASAYCEDESRSSSAWNGDDAQVRALELHSLPKLLRQYDNEARENFTKEALVFAIITAIGFVWPMAHTMRVLSA